MAVRSGGDFSRYENDLSDEDVLEHIGRYCEENIQAPMRAKEYHKQREREAAERKREWEVNKRKQFWSENWGWFVFGFIVLLIVFNL